MIRRSLVLLVLAAVAASGLGFGQGDAFTLRILHTNDHHSHLDGAAFDLTLDGTRTRVTLGGFSRIVRVIEHERTPNAIVLNSGELNGTLYFSVYKGEPDFLVFNALGLDAYALGNHEFDEGDARLAELVELANFPIVSSNALPEPASPLWRVRDQILPYVIREVEGERVGIIGVLKVEKTKNSSLVSEDVAFTPEIETAARMVAQLEAQGVDKIVLLSHVGYFNDLTIARAVRGIDVIVGGDSHSLLGDAAALGEIGLAPIVSNQTGPFAGASHGGLQALGLGAYPTVVRGPTGDPVLVVTAWEYAKALGVLDVTFDADGLVTGYQGSIVLPVEGPFAQPNAENQMVEVSPEAETAILAAIEASPLLRLTSPDASVEALLDPYREGVEAIKVEPIGSVEVTLDNTRIPEPFAAGETPTGSYAAFVVSQAFRDTNPAIDVAIQNAGGVRTQFLSGAFTVGDAIAALPFSNTIVMLDMNGASIVKVLNQAAHYALNTGSTGAFPYAAGLRYDVDLGGAEDAVILNVEAQERATGAWAPIDPERVYTVATNSFTALGRDNYLEFAAVREANPAGFEDTYINYFLPLKQYIQRLPGGVLPPIDVADYPLKSVVD
ncbi:MAG: 5'-nucleotidase C-terminal domain-containing protein [Trueperaceae bacterium]|nr:5'-nucleotidase C-terminal domain-containing protein [Trueperaceae bacterium]